MKSRSGCLRIWPQWYWKLRFRARLSEARKHGSGHYPTAYGANGSPTACACGARVHHASPSTQTLPTGGHLQTQGQEIASPCLQPLGSHSLVTSKFLPWLDGKLLAISEWMQEQKEDAR